MRNYAKIIVYLICFILTIISFSCVTSAPMPPVTTIFYNSETGYITLVAVDYGWPASGVNAIYYKIDHGEQTLYEEPFFIGEGTHLIEYWSVDNSGNVETMQSATFTYDTTPPTIVINSPENGIYLYGNKILISPIPICFGKVPVRVEADDGTGFGVSHVFFKVGNDTGYDSSPPYEYTFIDMNFGDLTITVYADDNKGLLSEPIEMTIKCYSLGLM